MIQHEYLFPSTADRLSEDNGCMFSTEKFDNDEDDGNLASITKAPWWYCSYGLVIPTGVYGEGTIRLGRGIRWFTPWNLDQHAKYLVMMIRPN